MWLALDEDNSGHISVGEFGNFLRLGDHVHDEMRQAKERKRIEEKERKVAEVRKHIAESLAAQRARVAEDEAAKHERAMRAKMVAEAHAKHVEAEARKEQARRRADAAEQERLQALRVQAHVKGSREIHQQHTKTDAHMKKVLAEHKSRKEALEKKLRESIEQERQMLSDERSALRSTRSLAGSTGGFRSDSSTI